MPDDSINTYLTLLAANFTNRVMASEFNLIELSLSSLNTPFVPAENGICQEKGVRSNQFHTMLNEKLALVFMYNPMK